jgi:hypothetical protein
VAKFMGENYRPLPKRQMNISGLIA